MKRRTPATASRLHALLCTAGLTASLALPRLAIAVNVPPAQAEVQTGLAAEPGPLLTLADAIDRAQKRNTDLAVAVARVQEAHATRNRANSAFLPLVQAVASYTHNSVEAKLDSSAQTIGLAKALGITLPPTTQFPPPSIIQRSDTFGASLTVDQTIFSLAPVLLNRAADRNVEAQAATVEATKREITYQVMQIYYNEAGVERLVQAAERAIALADQRIAMAQQRRAHGAEGEVTVLRAQAERDKSEQDLVRSQQARQQLLVALGTLLGDEPPARLGPPPEIEVPVGDEAGLVEQAVHERPDMDARRLAVLAVKAQVQEAEWRWMPMLTVNGTGRYTDTPGFIGKNWLWSASANLIVPIFDRGLRYADAAERRQTKVRLQLELDKAERDLRGNIRQAKVDIAAARRMLAVATSQSQKAKRTAEIVANAQAAGAATSFEVAEADTTLRLSEVGVERERLNLDLTILKLRHLTGGVRP